MMAIWWLVLAVAVMCLAILTVAYFRHDPVTCTECIRRRNDKRSER